MPQITKQHAEALCKKLGAVETTTRSSVHDIFTVFYEGKAVGTIGIRRSPRKDQGHGHVPEGLGVRRRFAYEMAICKWELPDYLREIGVLPPIGEAESELEAHDDLGLPSTASEPSEE